MIPSRTLFPPLTTWNPAPVSVSPVRLYMASLPSSVRDRDAAWLARFEAYLTRHHACPSLSVPQLADDFAMSESTLLRQVKRLTGRTPAQVLQTVRLERARQLIRSGRYATIQAVALAVGYRHATSFTRCYKAYFGELPSGR